MKFFENLETLPEDPILGLTVAFKEDPRPDKINLSIGIYQDEAGKTETLPSVLTAEKEVLEKHLSKAYSPIPGDPLFISLCNTLVFGKETAGILGMQTVGGTSALRVGADFLFCLPNRPKAVFLPNPTWANHKQVFGRAGHNVEIYPYYSEATRGFDFAGMRGAIQKMPKGSVIVLHTCCHNPTGIDPTEQQWEELSHLIKKQEVIPFFDTAYQGFGKGVQEDAFPIRHFAKEGHVLFSAFSCAKNFGLYGERVGHLGIRIPNDGERKAAFSHLKQIIRANYSNPPLHGARVVATILATPTLYKQWVEDLDAMRNRILEMRRLFTKGLFEKNSSLDFSFIERQKGMFSFTGLKKDQVARLRVEKGIFLTEDGRINIAALNHKNLDPVLAAIASVL